MSVEEYLRFEADSPIKHEYVAGDVYAMSGVTRRHARIVSNLVIRLGTAARGGPCEVIAVDVKLRVAHDRFYYPDVMVLCTPGSDEDVVLRDPRLIIEVTSRGTARVDRGEKLESYKGIASLRDYLIVDHRRRRVERHRRDEAGIWRLDEVAGQGTITLASPHVELTLDEIYEGVQPAIVGEDQAAYDALGEWQDEPEPASSR